MEEMKCPECGSDKISNNGEGMLCNKCGLVISEGYYSGRRMWV